LLEELKESNKSSNVNFLGQVPNKDISYYLSQSDVLVVPSKNRYEGFPRVILEAWACGLPIVVTNVGGVSAFVKNGYNGYLIPSHSYEHLKDAIVKIMNYSNYSQLLSGVRKSSEITTKDYWVRQFRDLGIH
ncbi:glycosyltransferase, partial [Salinivibrio sp. IB643]|uniref:glycosyltransferase n=1 Tax=Salinivibrio sp. IB643 TaxID=1909445 RepID=UPI0009C7F016